MKVLPLCLALPGAVLATPVAARDLGGVTCTAPPPAHCATTGCTPAETALAGNAVESGTGRRFFLDFPCDLKPDEKVIFILSLHGGGSIGNWQRHYFPLVDLKDKYRLVVATPSGTRLGWVPEEDDAYLRGIVEQVEDALGGRRNVRAFWLVGHSLGGQTSNRLLATPFYRERLTGWTSLSGGRLGSKRESIRAPIPGRASTMPTGAPARLAADASVLPDFAFSHIYSTGERELTVAGLPNGSPWAERLGCGARTDPRTVVDTRAGYVADSRPQRTTSPIWGGPARPGSASIYRYPGCDGGRIVADVVRIDKGHTEGFEPRITEEIVRLMVAAR